MEGLSSYARAFLGVTSKPDVDKIENLSPPVSIDQKSISRSPRSTAGTLTEVYDYLRILFAKIGVPHCYNCGNVMRKRNNSEILEGILSNPYRSQIAILSKSEWGSKNSKEILRQV
ncbi:MAG TPA: hypothetical protein ENG89_00155 [Candidatus Moranbacteria bacterium]|nr:hypothetical protein [Candidatus Moranbacteria bacterium]